MCLNLLTKQNNLKEGSVKPTTTFRLYYFSAEKIPFDWNFLSALTIKALF